MLTVSPKRQECIAKARQLYEAGDKTAAWDVLVGDRYDHGIDEEIDQELRRLFTLSPEQAATLAGYQQELDNPAAKERQQAARRISRFVLGTVSNRVLQFVQPPETMDFFIKNLDHPDPVVQEHMTICIARALDKYVHDDRALEPLQRMLSAAKENTRAWAIEGLKALSDDFVPFALALMNDKSARVRDSASAMLSLAIYGGGTVHRPSLGAKGRRCIAEAMLSYELTLPADQRTTRAWLLGQTAEPEHLPVLEEWHKKDKSKEVKKHLMAGIERLKGT